MSDRTKILTVIPDRIESKIFLIRGKKVMLDKDLAELYGVETKNLNRAMKRNIERFPEDFMFQLNEREQSAFLRFRIGTLKNRNLKSQSVTSSVRGKHRKYLAYAFTEQGVAMLSSVLNSARAIQVNIQIIRTFTKLRELIASNKELRIKAVLTPGQAPVLRNKQCSYFARQSRAVLHPYISSSLGRHAN